MTPHSCDAGGDSRGEQHAHEYPVNVHRHGAEAVHD